MDARTQQQIDKITKKVLWEAGLKEPPVDVDDVLSHLNLHRDYYDLADPSLGAEIKHALAIGVDRLAGILRKIRFLAATIPDRRETEHGPTSLEVARNLEICARTLKQNRSPATTPRTSASI